MHPNNGMMSVPTENMPRPTQYNLGRAHGDLTTLAPCDFNLPPDQSALMPQPVAPPLSSRIARDREPYSKREFCPYCSRSFPTRQEMVGFSYISILHNYYFLYLGR